MTTKRIAVIGAGYTGLTAALRLAQAGHQVEVFEATKSLGGLAGDFKIEGGSIEKAYHHLFRTDTEIIALSKELGIEDKLQWHTSDTGLYYQGVLHPFRGAIDLARFKPLHFHNRIRTGLVALYLQRTKNWQRFKSVTAYDWMKKAVGTQANQVIWEPLLKGKFDRYYDKVAMAWLWARIHIRANSKAKGDSREKLGYFEKGFETFTTALVKACTEAGVKIHTETKISAIGSHPTESTTLKFSDGSVENFSTILATIPSGIFAKLTAEQLSNQTKEKLNSIEYLAARVMIFSSTQDLSKYYWHNINDLELPFLVFINHTKLVSKDWYGGKNVYYLATYLPADHKDYLASDEELAKNWFEGLNKIFPEFDSTKIGELHQFKFNHAQHIADTNYSTKIPDHKTELPGVWLANFSQIFPEDRGTNYAVREGNLIAEKILAELD